MRKLSLIAVWIFLSAGLSQAQQQPGSLSGIKSANVNINEADAENKSCGITDQLIREAVMYPISGSRLKVSSLLPPSTDVPILSVAISTVRGGVTSGLCLSGIRIQLAIYQPLTLPFASGPRMHKVMLWEGGWHGGSMQHDHAKQIREQIELLMKRFVTAWNLDNKPPQ
jgi:hypothetical protein